MSDTIDLLQIKIERAKEELPAETLNAIATVDWRAAIMHMREKKGYNFEQLGDLEVETELLLCGLLSPADYPKEIQARMKISKAETDELVNEMNILVFKKIKEELIKNTERKKIFAKRNENSMTADLPAEMKIEIPAPSAPAQDASMHKTDTGVLKSAGIEVVKPLIINKENRIENREDMLRNIENPEKIIRPEKNPDGSQGGSASNMMHPLLQQKILGSMQIPMVKTAHTLDNISKGSNAGATPPLSALNSAKAEASLGKEESTKSSYKVDPYRLAPDE